MSIAKALAIEVFSWLGSSIRELIWSGLGSRSRTHSLLDVLDLIPTEAEEEQARQQEQLRQYEARPD